MLRRPEVNVYVCETAFHVMESIAICKQQDSSSIYSVLVVMNEPRVGYLEREEIQNIFDRAIIGNIKLNLNSIHSTDNRHISQLNSLLNDFVWLFFSIHLFFVSLIFKINIYFGTESPQFISQLRVIKYVPATNIHHFEDGMGAYTAGSQKRRSTLSRTLYPYDLPRAIEAGVIDSLYATHPNQLEDRYPRLNLLKIDLADAETDITRVFREVSLPSHSKTPFLLLTQPLVKNNYLSQEEYREKFESLLSSLDSDFFVLLKPHPGEEIKYYKKIVQRFSDVELIGDKQNPAEVVAWSLKKEYERVYVGSTGYSTAILNLSQADLSLYVFGSYFKYDTDITNSTLNWLSKQSIVDIEHISEIHKDK